MSEPLLSSSRFPYLPVQVSLGDWTEHTDALVDTGFTGYLVVPVGFLNGQAPDSYDVWTVADGRRVVASTYAGALQIGNFPPIEVLITVLGDEAILGRSVTNRFRVIFDHGERVFIEP